MSHVLTLITFIPIAGMVLILALPDSMKNLAKWIAVAATVPQLLITAITGCPMVLRINSVVFPGQATVQHNTFIGTPTRITKRLQEES